MAIIFLKGRTTRQRAYIKDNVGLDGCFMPLLLGNMQKIYIYAKIIMQKNKQNRKTLPCLDLYGQVTAVKYLYFYILFAVF